MKPEQIEKIRGEVIDRSEISHNSINFQYRLIQAGYDFAIQSLAEITDEGMLLTKDEREEIEQKFREDMDGWWNNASDNERYNLTNSPDDVNIREIKAQLSKVLSIVRAKVEKQENPFDYYSYPSGMKNSGYERCRQATLKLLGGK